MTTISGKLAPVTGITDSSGTLWANARPRIVRVVGPASYTTGGTAVDCSSFFSRILAVQVLRNYMTATMTEVGARPIAIAETGTDTYANAKFRALAIQAYTNHTHNYDKPNTPTGGPSAAPTAGADAAHTHTLSFTSTATSGPNSFSTARAELGAGGDLSANTYEFLVWGVPV